MSDDAFGQILGKLTQIEQGLTGVDQRLTEAEQRLTARMNNQFERVLNRLTAVEGDVHNLRSEHSVTRDLVMKLPATVLGAIEDRVRKLEDPESGP
jgi:hypothetical protein